MGFPNWYGNRRSLQAFRSYDISFIPPVADCTYATERVIFRCYEERTCEECKCACVGGRMMLVYCLTISPGCMIDRDKQTLLEYFPQFRVEETDKILQVPRE